MLDAETALAMLSLEAATALVFAAGFLLGCLLTCCCLRCRKHAEPESQVTFKVDMPKSYPVPKGIEQCSKVYFFSEWEQGSFESNLLGHARTYVERYLCQMSVLIEEE